MKNTHEPSHRLSPLQTKILAIYKEVKKIIDRHGLRCFAVGGTCIGAVRHKGFIPWDDDLDMMLPDRDYELFIQYARTELPAHLQLRMMNEHHHMSSLGLKVYDTATTFIEEQELRYPDEYKGVFIDIFRLGGAPGDGRERAEFCRKLLLYKRLDEKRRLCLRDMHSSRAKLSWIAALPLRLLPYRFWVTRVEKLTGRYPYDSHALSALIPKLIMRRDEVFGDGCELPFEDTTIRCAKDTHQYLSIIFGDYMQLPPESERQGHHALSAFVDLEKPYAYYQQHGLPKKVTV